MKRIDVDELRRRYDGVRKGSVRWEGLQTYEVPWEGEGFAAWRRGDPPPPDPDWDEWLSGLRCMADSGRPYTRIRGLRRPATEYTRHEFEVAYPQNAAAGEMIYVLDLDAHPEFDSIEDFVVFDDDAVMWYRYDADFHLLGYDLSDDPTDVADHAAILRRMMAAAVPLATVIL